MIVVVVFLPGTIANTIHNPYGHHSRHHPFRSSSFSWSWFFQISFQICCPECMASTTKKLNLWLIFTTFWYFSHRCLAIFFVGCLEHIIVGLGCCQTCCLLNWLLWHHRCSHLPLLRVPCLQPLFFLFIQVVSNATPRRPQSKWHRSFGLCDFSGGARAIQYRILNA